LIKIPSHAKRAVKYTVNFRALQLDYSKLDFISQGSVATRLGCVDDEIIANLLQIEYIGETTLKKRLKLILRAVITYDK